MWNTEKLRASKTFYHATTENEYESILKGISLHKCSNQTDFGRGFYLTTNYNQAFRWARKKAELLNKAALSIPGFTAVNGLIVEYTVDVDSLLGLDEDKFCIFTESNIKWAKFIYRNRIRYPINNGMHNRDGKYHVVYGPVADGNILESILAKHHNKITYQEFCDRIKSRRDFSEDDQLSFHNEDSLVNLLEFKGADKVEYSISK